MDRLHNTGAPEILNKYICFRSLLPSSLSIRVNRTPRSTPTLVNPFGSSRLAVAVAAKQAETPNIHRGGPVPPELPEPERRVTLTSLVSDYLSNKHALCRNPMTTCPEFDLFLPHRSKYFHSNYYVDDFVLFLYRSIYDVDVGESSGKSL